jgi:hypothetical protein
LRPASGLALPLSLEKWHGPDSGLHAFATLAPPIVWVVDLGTALLLFIDIS